MSSRNKVSELTANTENVVRVDGKKSTLAQVATALETDSLFSSKKTVVVEHFTKVKPLPDLIARVLELSNNPDTEIILWDADDPDVKTKNALKVAKSYLYTFPKPYYSFLDSFAPNSSSSLELLHEVLKTFEPEQALYGLTRRVRHLLVLKANDYSNFSDFKRMQSWQLGKLKQQSNLWSEKQLEKVFMELAELDEKIKTSALTMPLANHLDILLMQDL